MRIQIARSHRNKQQVGLDPIQTFATLTQLSVTCVENSCSVWHVFVEIRRTLVGLTRSDKWQWILSDVQLGTDQWTISIWELNMASGSTDRPVWLLALHFCCSELYCFPWPLPDRLEGKRLSCITRTTIRPWRRAIGWDQISHARFSYVFRPVLRD